MIVWLSRRVILAIHDEQLAAHGGASGLRDATLLDSALARPRNRLAYGEPDLAELAALHAIAIARNHPFIDGNKRTALVVCRTFLILNNHNITATQTEKHQAFLTLAAGVLLEPTLAQWL